MLYKHPRDKKIAYYDPLELLWAILRIVTRVQKQRAPAFEHAMEQVLVSLGPPELPEVEDLLQLGLEPTAIVAWLSTVFDIFGDHGNSVLARSVREPKRKLTKAEQRAADAAYEREVLTQLQVDLNQPLWRKYYELLPIYETVDQQVELLAYLPKRVFRAIRTYLMLSISKQKIPTNEGPFDLIIFSSLRRTHLVHASSLRKQYPEKIKPLTLAMLSQLEEAIRHDYE